MEFPARIYEHCRQVGACPGCANPFQVANPVTKIDPVEARQLQKEILRLKAERNAILLVHNYVTPVLQDVADYVGDSLGLSRQAAKTDAPIIVFCGVNFMAETAKILNPGGIVLIRDPNAGCSLEECCDARDLAKIKAEHPEFFVVSYINCSSAVKALSDVICTSGNAVQIVEHCPKDRPILFVPDQNLGAWVAEQTHREMVLFPGYCYAHTQFTAEAVLAAKEAHPKAKVLAHPECLAEVKALADEVSSTEKMLRYCKSGVADEFIVVTEFNMLHRLRKECPGKVFHSLPVRGYEPLCKHMLKTTPAGVIQALKTLEPQIRLPEEILVKAKLPIERMLEFSN